MLVTHRTTEVMGVLVATELVVAARALNLAGRAPAGAGLQPLFAAATDTLPAGRRGSRVRPGRRGGPRAAP